MRNGVVVGKFSPLHRGHEWMIDQALKQCDHLLIVSYSNPEFKGCEAKVREEWLWTTYKILSAPPEKCTILVLDPNKIAIPLNTAPDDVQQWFFAWVVKSIAHYEADILFCSESWGDACAKVLSEELGREVKSVIIDIDRKQYPISATQIRNDYDLNRHMLSSTVRETFVKRICLLGGESTGKSTLAKALAEYYNTLWVPEYGRELYEERNGVLYTEDFYNIIYRQVNRELNMQPIANKYLFCDTSPLTTYGYHTWMKGWDNEKLRLRAQVRTYDGYIFCQPDFAFVQDGTRIDSEFRDMQQKWYREQFKQMRIKAPILEVEGSTEERCAIVVDWLRKEFS